MVAGKFGESIDKSKKFKTIFYIATNSLGLYYKTFYGRN